MRVVIAGCGRVGSELARHLITRGHDIAVIDKDPGSFARLGVGFGGETLRGRAFERESLEAAGIRHADAFVAVTSGDNSNVVAAIVAKEEYLVPKVLARIYDPERADIYRRLGIQAIASVTWTVNEVLDALAHPGFAHGESLGDGEVRLVSVEVSERLEGRLVEDLERIGEVRVAAIVRSGRSSVPTGAMTLRAGDLVYVTVAAGALGQFEHMVAP